MSFRLPAQREGRLLPRVLGSPSRCLPARLRHRCPAPAGPVPSSLLTWPRAVRDGAAWAPPQTASYLHLEICTFGRQFGWIPLWFAVSFAPPPQAPTLPNLSRGNAVLENKVSRGGFKRSGSGVAVDGEAGPNRGAFTEPSLVHHAFSEHDFPKIYAFRQLTKEPGPGLM